MIPESWRRPIPPGEMNPISATILRSVFRFALLVLTLYMLGWLAHMAWGVFLAGWDSR